MLPYSGGRDSLGDVSRVLIGEILAMGVLVRKAGVLDVQAAWSKTGIVVERERSRVEFSGCCWVMIGGGGRYDYLLMRRVGSRYLYELDSLLV